MTTFQFHLNCSFNKPFPDVYATHYVHTCCENLYRAPCQAVIRSQNWSAIPHFISLQSVLKWLGLMGEDTLVLLLLH